jgi:hypothetical protein
MQLESVCESSSYHSRRKWSRRSIEPSAWKQKSESVSDPRRWVVSPRNSSTSSVAPQKKVAVMFHELIDRWKRETVNLSDLGQIILHESYQQVIGMGPDALPLILAALAKELDWWFPALKAITGQDPVQADDQGDLEAMRAAWLSWATSNGYR